MRINFGVNLKESLRVDPREKFIVVADRNGWVVHGVEEGVTVWSRIPGGNDTGKGHLEFIHKWI